MRGTNKQVASNWRNSKPCTSSNGNYHTDGDNLYSYHMLIGRTLPDGTKQVLDVRAKYSYSVTTSRHVSLAIGNNTKLVTPIVTRSSWSSWREFPKP